MDKRIRKLDEFLTEIKNCLSSAHEIRNKKLSDNKWLDKLNVTLPIFNDQPNSISKEIPFDFYAPNEFTLVGDYRLGTGFGEKSIAVHLAVEIPVKTFSRRDYLNQTYHRKRAVYLAVLASNLCKFSSTTIQRLEFCWKEGDSLKPVLKITPKGKLGEYFEIYILPYASKRVWKMSRFLPSTSNLRPEFCGFDFSDTTMDSKGGNVSDTKNSKKNSHLDMPTNEKGNVIKGHFSTPHYSQSILEDTVLVDFTAETLNDYGDSVTLREGISLVKTWLRIRGLHENFGGKISAAFIHCVIRYLLKIRRLSQQTHSYQVFRIFVLALSQDILAHRDLTLFSADKNEKSNLPTSEDFRKYFDFVLIDSSGYYNVCSNLDNLTYARLKHEASIALKVLEMYEFENAFSILFSDQVPFYMKFDQYFSIRLPSEWWDKFSKCASIRQEFADLSFNKIFLINRHIVQLLTKAIGSRVLLIQSESESVFTRDVADNIRKPEFPIVLTFGVLLNSDTYSNPLEKGPASDSSDASEFRSFWGDKSEMRKFADTSICEAVLWCAENQSIKRTVVAQIVKYVLNKHLNITPSCIRCTVDPFSRVISNSKLRGTGEEEYQQLSGSFDELTKYIRLLDDLPLSINRVFCVSPAIRQTEVLPVLPTFPINDQTTVSKFNNCAIPLDTGSCTPPFCPALEVHLTLESSGKWPDDLQAVHHLKMAFYVKIAEMLTIQFSLLVSVREDCVLVFLNGYVFRLLIVYSREVVLLKTSIADGGIVKTKDTKASMELDKEINHKPKLCSYLNGISQQFPAYGLTCRLFKRWLYSHMLTDYITEEAAELLVGFIFLTPRPFTVPNSSLAGFIRLLSLLASFDWLAKPLIINLNNQLDKNQLKEIESQFVQLRPTLPPMCLCTPEDQLGVLWTRPNPTAMIVERLTSLAKSSLEYLENNLLKQNCNFDPDVIFRTPLDAYDMLIYLNENHVARRFLFSDESSDIENGFRKRKPNTNRNMKSMLPVVDYDPVELFVNEIKNVYQDFAMFFYDKCGGDVVGVLWKPQKCSDDNDSVVNFDVGKIVENINSIGNGLVKKIRTK